MTHLVDLSGLRLTRPATRHGPGYSLTIPHFRLSAGDRIGLVGPSGSGKSSLLDMLALIRRPDAVTRFCLSGQDVTQVMLHGRLDRLTALRARHVGYVLQDGGLLPYLTVRGNALLAARLAGQHDRDAITVRARFLGMADLLDKSPAALSGGQRQRAAVLRGLASNARILLADEPTAALDAANAQTVIQLLADLPADRAVVVSSHNEDLLSQAGFRLLRIALHHDAGQTCATLSEAA